MLEVVINEAGYQEWKDDGIAAELEMQDCLYGLVRYLKPELVFESGTCSGKSTKALGMACRVNRKGRVISCDNQSWQVERAQHYIGHMPEVEIRHASSLDCRELSEADFIFSDSDYPARKEEFQRAKSGCIFVVHDTALHGPMRDMVVENRGLNFPMGRGFGIIRKE